MLPSKAQKRMEPTSRRNGTKGIKLPDEKRLARPMPKVSKMVTKRVTDKVVTRKRIDHPVPIKQEPARAAKMPVVVPINKKKKARQTIFLAQGSTRQSDARAVKRYPVTVKCPEIVTPGTLKRLKLEQEIKIANMLNRADTTVSEYMLNADSIKADQPEGLLVDLMEHQKTSIAKMISLENDPFTDGGRTYYTGLLSDATGSGKSLSILSLICLNQLKDSDGYWSPCNTSIKRQRVPFLDLNLILVMPHILHQWQQYLDTQTTLKHGIIREQHVKLEDLEEMAAKGCQVVLVNNEITDSLLKINVKVARFVIDEIDLYISTRKNRYGFSWIMSSNINLRCMFCWFLTATPEVLYTNKPPDSTVFHRFPYSCFASLPLDRMCQNLVVRNETAFVESNLKLDRYSHEVIRCSLSQDVSRCLKSIPECQLWATRDGPKLKRMMFCHNFQDLTKYFDEIDVPNKINPDDTGVVIASFGDLYQVLTHPHAHKRICRCDKKPKIDQTKSSTPDKITSLVDLLKKCGSGTLVFANDSKSLHQEIKGVISCDIFEKSTAEEQLSSFGRGEIGVLFLESMESMRGGNMEMADNLVIFGNPDTENRVQIIGRAQRYGRKGKLKVFELRYEGE
jgi:hypothetical protein